MIRVLHTPRMTRVPHIPEMTSVPHTPAMTRLAHFPSMTIVLHALAMTTVLDTWRLTLQGQVPHSSGDGITISDVMTHSQGLVQGQTVTHHSVVESSHIEVDL